MKVGSDSWGGLKRRSGVLVSLAALLPFSPHTVPQPDG